MSEFHIDRKVLLSSTNNVAKEINQIMTKSAFKQPLKLIRNDQSMKNQEEAAQKEQLTTFDSQNMRDLLISHPDEQIETETLSVFDSMIDKEIALINENQKELNIQPVEDSKMIEFQMD